jgi:hypothetical protein
MTRPGVLAFAAVLVLPLVWSLVKRLRGVLVMLGGYLAATLVFTPLFLLYAARARPRTAIVYTLVLGIVLLSLPSLLPVDLPFGVLQ